MWNPPRPQELQTFPFKVESHINCHGEMLHCVRATTSVWFRGGWFWWKQWTKLEEKTLYGGVDNDGFAVTRGEPTWFAEAKLARAVAAALPALRAEHRTSEYYAY
jgi:hypothetical protein